jgi:hypothetical protein
LARYEDDTGSWEIVRPLGGDEDVPAKLMAPGPDGDLWVLLADWYEDWSNRVERGDPAVVLTLAHYDGVAGRWTLYAEDLPVGYPGFMAAGRGSVWIDRGGEGEGFDPVPGVARFDGRTWTTYLEDTPAVDGIADIAVAADGTVWYAIEGEILQLLP